MVTFLTPLAPNSGVVQKGSIGRAFAVRIRTENRDQASFCPSAPREVSVLAELALGHLRYPLTDVPPQSNSPPDAVFGAGRRRGLPPRLGATSTGRPRVREGARFPPHRVSKETTRVVVFHRRPSPASHLSYAPRVSSQGQTRVKLNRVFFPR